MSIINGKPDIKSLGLPVNTANNDLDFFIGRDESFIILAMGANSELGLFISFKKNDSWTIPEKIGDESGSATYVWAICHTG
jgi:hypothetical protein